MEGRVDADDLVQQAVARDRLALVVGPTHPWASRRSIKGPDLLAAEWVLREPGSGTRSELGNGGCNRLFIEGLRWIAHMGKPKRATCFKGRVE